MLELNVKPTERIHFKNPSEADVARVKEIDYLNLEDNPPELVEAKINFVLDGYRDKGEKDDVLFSVYGYDVNEELIGEVMLHGPDTSRMDLSVRIVEEKQKQGYGFEMTREVIRAVFTQLDNEYLAWEFFIDNEGSRRLATKLGGVPQYKSAGGEIYYICRDERDTI